MKSLFPALLPIFLLLVAAQSQADSVGNSGSSGDDSLAVKVESAVRHGANAAAHGVERSAKAVEYGIKRGVSAAAKGIERGAQATSRAADTVARKAAETSNSDK
jgi:hypothetical protein